MTSKCKTCDKWEKDFNEMHDRYDEELEKDKKAIKRKCNYKIEEYKELLSLANKYIEELKGEKFQAEDESPFCDECKWYKWECTCKQKKGCNCHGICLDKSCKNQSLRVSPKLGKVDTPEEPRLSKSSGTQSLSDNSSRVVISKKKMSKLKPENTLSDKFKLDFQEERRIYREEDLKQSIKKLKDWIRSRSSSSLYTFYGTSETLLNEIDKEFGDKLIK